MSEPSNDSMQDPLIGQTLDGRLRVLRRIGEGGMGTVYVAEHVGLGKQVAVKVLNAQYAGQADVVGRLHSEARHASAIHNEHIVAVFDIGTTQEGRPYVVMEFLHGESLAERLRRCRILSEADTLHIGRQLASALAAAHKSGIVHRDIKPENIFLCPRDDRDFVKVLDFGISKALSTGSGSPGEPPVQLADPRLTRTGAILGTPLYMSPEQVRGESLDHRVDIYALGIVFYECLTGSVPFLAPSYLAVVAKILTEMAEPPSLRSPERALPPALEQIVLRAMAHQKEARYPSMDALLEDLERYAAGRELQQTTEIGRPQTSGARREAEPAAPGMALPLWPVLLAAAIVLGVGLLLTLRREPQPLGAADGFVPPPQSLSSSAKKSVNLPPTKEPLVADLSDAQMKPADMALAATPVDAAAAAAADAARPVLAAPPLRRLRQAPSSSASPVPGRHEPHEPIELRQPPAQAQPLLEEQAPNPFPLPAPR